MTHKMMNWMKRCEKPADEATKIIKPRRSKRNVTMAVMLFSGAAVMRTLVGFHPFSGAENYHGQKLAYGGDYEAQRHWMEITWHLPISEWYYYDLEYWGLDYPPLTAYVSYACGGLSHHLVSPESVALDTSRGYEGHKAFMRATVLVTDLLVYGTAVYAFASRCKGGILSNVFAFALPMLHPAMLLIDHGHFQYNTTALGLSLWCFYYLTNNTWKSSCYAAVFFCLALNFKQMTLYYAPAVFFYLLGDCFSRKRPILKVFTLGGIVISVFTILWLPFVLNGPPDSSALNRIIHVLRRIFPFSRGLFEGKVANFWCAASVRPFRIRQRIPAELQPLAALGLTTLAMMPSCVRMFQVGLQKQPSADLMLWGMTSCALAFFLASFQVHEKSLLIALAPASLLGDAPFLRWLACFGTWTLWPLLTVDRLQTAYFCTTLVYAISFALKDILTPLPRCADGVIFRCTRIIFSVLAVVLHVLEPIVTPPRSLPDLFPVLWSVVGCGCLCTAYFYTVFKMYSIPVASSFKSKIE